MNKSFLLTGYTAAGRSICQLCHFKHTLRLPIAHILTRLSTTQTRASASKKTVRSKAGEAKSRVKKKDTKESSEPTRKAKSKSQKTGNKDGGEDAPSNGSRSKTKSEFSTKAKSTSKRTAVRTSKPKTVRDARVKSTTKTRKAVKSKSNAATSSETDIVDETDAAKSKGSGGSAATVAKTLVPAKRFRSVIPRRVAFYRRIAKSRVRKLVPKDHDQAIIPARLRRIRKLVPKGRDQAILPVRVRRIRNTRASQRMVDYSSLPRLTGRDLEMHAIPTQQPPIARLAHELERVLFNPGICHVRDPRTRVYNVDPHLERLMPVQEFDFNSLNIFTPPSKDETLAKIARNAQKKYVASTSSLTGALKHFHYLLSAWRPVSFDMLSKSFPTFIKNFTKLQRAPDAIFLRWKDGVYAVDADKMYDSANVLSLMGRYMEKLLVLNKEDFFRHKVGSKHPVTEQERSEPEAFHYSTVNDFVLRSQLDAQDPRLPGSGVFDLKTRAVVPIRMDSAEFESGMGYEIRSLHGEWQSFEREYHDMIRSTMLKYSLQVRMGRMDGIFVAYHNIARIFGFQYISLEEMDLALHGQRDRALGDQEFLLSLRLLNDIFNRATERFPEQSLRLHFDTRDTKTPFMYIFIEPVTEEETVRIQTMNRDKIEQWEQNLLKSGMTGQEGQEVNVEQDATSAILAPVNATERPDTSPLETQSKSEGNISELGQTLSQASFTDTNEVSDTAQEQSGPEQPQKPILAYELFTHSHVNNHYVIRPSNDFPSSAKWDVSYELNPITNEARAQALYIACKTRRQKEFSGDRKLGGDTYYKNILRRMTEEGRQFREEMNKLEEREREEGRDKRMWNDKMQQERKLGGIKQEKEWWRRLFGA